MKKISLLPILLILTTGSLLAQISGTKVIGTPPSDYTTFAAAVNALNTSGVNGNVIFNVKPGTYNEQISLNAISGAASTRTITFQSQNGDSTSVILQFPSSASATNNYVIQLNGSDYVTFRKMTIKRTDTLAFSQVIDIKNKARKNSFLNNIIEGSTKAGSSTFSVLVGSDNTNLDCFNTFSNNIFRYGNYGFNFLGLGSTQPDSGTVITNNKFISQSYRAIYATSQRYLYIAGNEITTTSTHTGFNAIHVQYPIDTLRILKNKISIANGGYGIQLQNANPSTNIKGMIANNFIAVGGSSGANGIYLETCKHLYVFYNSINIYSTFTTSGAALNIGGSGTDYIYVKNNALANTGGGYSYYVSSTVSGATSLPESNYNDLYTTGVYVGHWKGTNTQLISNWRSQSGLDAQSVSANPIYNSPADLHATNDAINGKATPNTLLVTINTDIDNEMRSATAPDIGADEFNVEDLGVYRIAVNNGGYCPGTHFSVMVKIRNFGLYTYNGSIPVYYRIGGQTQISETIPSVVLNAGDSLSYTFVADEVQASAGTFKIKAGTNVATDRNHANDTTSRNLLILSSPATDAGNDAEICPGQSATLNATGGVSFVWSCPPPNTGASVNVSPSATTVYYVTGTSAQGCTAIDSVTVTVVTPVQPLSSFTFSASDLAVQFTNASANADTWAWDFGDGNSSAQQDPWHLYALQGNYVVTLIASNLCLSDTTSQNISVVGLQDNETSRTISLFPVPCSHLVNISGLTPGSDYDLELRNLSGQTVLKEAISPSEPVTTLRVDDLNPGLYTAIIKGKDRIFVLKVLINK